jgi:multicomponent K+:H+ antiporter subunit G
MTETLQDVPLWAECVTAVLVFAGATLTLLGNIGLVKLRNFYERVHAPTLGATLGVGFILIAAIIHFWAATGKPALLPVLIAAFMTITTPVTLIMLVRAAVYRDRTEGNPEAPKEI